jgi:hypothetical protein
MLGCSGPWPRLQCFYTINPTRGAYLRLSLRYSANPTTQYPNVGVGRGEEPDGGQGRGYGLCSEQELGPLDLSLLPVYYLPNAHFARSFGYLLWMDNNFLCRGLRLASSSRSHIEKPRTLRRLLGISACAENLDIELCYKATTTNPMDTVVRNIHPENQETVVIQIQIDTIIPFGHQKRNVLFFVLSSVPATQSFSCLFWFRSQRSKNWENAVEGSSSISYVRADSAKSSSELIRVSHDEFVVIVGWEL